MLTLIIEKMLHKKWMIFCFLIGNILLIAVAASYPMYRNSSFQRMLTDEFSAYEEENNEWPAVVSMLQTRAKGKSGITFEKMYSYMTKSLDALGVPVDTEIFYLNTALDTVSPIVKRDSDDRNFRVSVMTGLEDHIDLYAGSLPREGLVDGYFEVIVSESFVSEQDVLLDEIFEFDNFTLSDGSPLRVKIVGFFREANAADTYWMVSTSSMYRDVFVSYDTFETYFLGDDAEQTYGCRKAIYELLDYTAITPSQVSGIIQTTYELINGTNYGSIIQDNVYEGILESYSAKAKRVEASLLILQIPVLALLLAFIYMISSQMLSMEQNEISVMKSRGAKGGQILQMYFLQNLILNALALVIGIPLGWMFTALIGKASDFMEFAGTRVLEVQISSDVLLYAAAAVLLTMVITILPAFSYSKITIVNLKQSRARAKRSLWKIACLDFICIGVSLYGYWISAKNEANVIEQVLTGESLDPLLYLSSSLFLCGCGLLAVRLQPLLLKLWFSLTRGFMRPASYVSFLSAIRGSKKQEFIMLFMILTVALGIQNTTVARTIVSNSQSNASYLNGADVVVRETWKSNASTPGITASEIAYTEPDYSRYALIEGIDAMTRVLQKTITTTGRDSISINVMGIYTSEFAQVANMPEELLPYTFYEYLNVLATSETAVLLSENFMTRQGYQIGDVITIPDNEDNSVRLTVVGFFTYWPGYEPVTYSLGSDGTLEESENYQMVVNMSLLSKKWNSYPYEIWMKVSDTTGLYTFVAENEDVTFTIFNDLEVTYDELKSDTLFQGTNGILTMSFIIVLLLCGVGYLIYFILSIRSRELLFGVLRAMGMKRGEINKMLLLEQIFCGLYAIVAGGVVGIIGSYLFVPLIQNAYAASDQVLPLELVTNQSDLVQLFAIIGVMMLLCLFVISRITAHMNITKALKLGED